MLLEVESIPSLPIRWRTTAGLGAASPGFNGSFAGRGGPASCGILGFLPDLVEDFGSSAVIGAMLA